MGKGLHPDYYVQKIEELKIDFLKARGIKGLIVDLDNTLTPLSSQELPGMTQEWLNEVLASGLKVCIVSNNFEGRVQRFAGIIGIPGISKAVKPRRRAFRQALKLLDLESEQVAVVGDQIFTDVLGGNRLGLTTILVDSLSRKEFIGTKLFRRIEKLIKRRMIKQGKMLKCQEK